MSTEKQDWILAGDAGLHNMYLGKLAPGVSSEAIIAKFKNKCDEPLDEPLVIELFEVRLVLHQVVSTVGPRGELTIQTLFKIMPFPTNPDGGHVVIKASTIIDVEGDAPTKEMLMGQLRECAVLEQQERTRRSKLILPTGGSLAGS
jgi:hypothetical protein